MIIPKTCYENLTKKVLCSAFEFSWKAFRLSVRHPFSVIKS